jgi:hypothetical protein
MGHIIGYFPRNTVADRPLATGYRAAKTPAPLVDNMEAESVAMAAAIAGSDAGSWTAPHEEVREWLLRLAAGDFDAPLPESH